MAFDGTLKFDTSIDQSGFESGLSKLGSLAQTGMAAVAGAVTAASGAMAALGTKALEAYADYEQLTGGVETLFGEVSGSIRATGQQALDEMSDDVWEKLGQQVYDNAAAFKEWENDVGSSMDAVADAMTYGIGTASADVDGYIKYLTDSYQMNADDAQAMADAVSAAISSNIDDLGNYASAMEDIPNAAQMVSENASKAFRTAGLSANDYMETVTSFSAALIASLDGDTVRAAEVADRAIIDMADNANKMGSSMESIQNAYQGFAKQNYTMLDNLKLGYGGTKSEMERLLADAQAISGIEYNIESYADVVEAIHVIQDQMGITGTTSKEAAETISGSIAMTKSAFSNLMIGIADDSQDFDKLMNDLVASATAAAGNILPRVQTITGGLGKLIKSASGIAADFAVSLMEFLPELVNAGVSMVSAIAQGFSDNAPALLTALIDAAGTLIDGIVEIVPILWDFGMQIITTIAESIVDNMPEISAKAGEIIEQIGQTLSEDLPVIIEAAYGIIMALVNALTQNIGVIITAAVQIITAIVTALLNPDSIMQLLNAGIELLKAIAKAIVDNLPLLIQTAITLVQTLVNDILRPDNILKLIEAAIDILITLTEAIIDNLDEILIACEQIIMTIVEELLKPENIRKLLELGGRLLAEIIRGLGQIAGKLAGFAWDLFTELGNTLASIDWAQLGVQIVEGICSGLLDCDFVLDDFLSDFGENWVSGIRDVFGIHSPSRVMREQVGRYLAEGVGEGFEAYMPRVSRSVTDLLHAPDSGIMPSATGSVVSSNYYYHSTQTGSPNIDVHVHFSADMDGEKIAEKVAEKVDILQGEAITFDERGTAH